MSDFDLVWNLYRSMDYPAMPLEESVKHCEGMHILRSVARYMNAFSEGDPCGDPNVPYSSTGVLQDFFGKNV